MKRIQFTANFDEFELDDVLVDIEEIETEPYPYIKKFNPWKVSLIIGKEIDIAFALDKEQAEYAVKVINEHLNTPLICQYLSEQDN